MCGIVGIVAGNLGEREREALVWRMVLTIFHRGPDDQVVTCSGDATLGTARLSIVDRAAARQPMSLEFAGKRAWIAYNGEVYNFAELRETLQDEGLRFRTRSDTETVLGAHLRWGPDAVERLDGMFAYAIWDETRKELLLVRDRLGIKPLFYVDFGDALLFASEPKALFCHPRLSRRPNATAILEYFLHGAAFASGYVTHDRSFFEDVRALPPGHTLVWAPRGSQRRQYWSPVQEVGTQRTDERATQDEVADTVTQSVRSMLMGEVPIGTALSGGLDSSLLTAEAVRAMDRELVSACITYRDDFDDPDAHHAMLLSRWLNHQRPGCHRLEYTYLPEERYLDCLDELVMAFDEPHWELRQLATFENYRTLARAGRTVVLTGEGADEIFFGYYQKFPGFRTSVLSGPEDFARLWKQRIPWVERLLSPAFANGLVSHDTVDELVDSAIASYLAPCWQETGSQLRAVQCWYLHTFLSWLLTMNDRCSMAHGLEGRFPFLSQQLVSLALQTPPEWSVATTGPMQEKILLRRAASSRLPVEIWRDREKAPLPVPQASSHHAQIAQRLTREVERAPAGVWNLLDKKMVNEIIAAWHVRRQAVGHNEGESLTSYIPLGQELQARTAHLFAILTLLRWYDLYFETGNKLR